MQRSVSMSTIGGAIALLYGRIGSRQCQTPCNRGQMISRSGLRKVQASTSISAPGLTSACQSLTVTVGKDYSSGA